MIRYCCNSIKDTSTHEWNCPRRSVVGENIDEPPHGMTTTTNKETATMTSKHTPGPWHLLRVGKRWLIAQGEDTGANGDPIAEVCDWRYPDGDTENAHLIAAAPDLLAACEAALAALSEVKNLNPGDEQDEFLHAIELIEERCGSQLRDARAKARGEG